MNLFVLDLDPSEAAKAHCDKHVCKMLIETSQMLSTSLHVNGVNGVPMKPCYVNHPITKWVGKTRANYRWTLKLLDGLFREYTERYGKVHACQRYLNYFIMHAHCIPEGPMLEFPQCMPDQYKDADPVQAYRKYYKGEKSKFAKWRAGNIPLWWDV